MNNTRPTITQVAKEAGVSIATVSGILNHRSDCYASEQTRKRVLEVVERLGYKPSLMANALHGKATMTVGLVVPGIDVLEVAIRTMANFELAARDRGYLVITACTQNEPAWENQVLGKLMDRCVDGIAIHPCERGPHVELKRLVTAHFPVVTFDGAGRLDFATDDVSIDQFQGGVLQAEHLLELGRTRVCVVNNRESCYVNEQKIAGLEQTFRKCGIGTVTRMNLSMPIHTHEHWNTDEFEEIRRFLRERGKEFDALVAVGDILAVSAMRIASELGLRVPGDLAVIGFNDIVLAQQVTPSLTTVHDPCDQMGQTAFRLLDERLHKKRPASQLRQEKLAPLLKARESTLGRPTQPLQPSPLPSHRVEV